MVVRLALGEFNLFSINNSTEVVMGEFADAIIEGDACITCGIPIDNLGYSRYCAGCEVTTDEDDGDYYSAQRHAKQAKKRRNKETSTRILEDNNITFKSFNNGLHLVISHNGQVWDFWPSTGKFKLRGGDSGRGVFRLLKNLGV